ncbi:uncharacterized protein LOC117122962 [Anneissia japonica]|uniref:uncharacterized protein LOC117122962 n=1 Tax=Anneissia japonica TaxID=1529436 RepID=UPI0014256487|nr:uncharacterized protein LOC117122962 [Anneissia japonica]XP_033124629.1 uncharacterized protein LOC117122962 [Anneissia japonica]XP_033124630.1 uncharacterized protein LOC117122962 [Anneissia japonica]XP_033124631.1 uncharacterized protein LOC117122962 [Anneissia japonica]XP_033124632.1 uncharacterized protein LOC117122962 [Anneissia japonica]XP_033124633.1 uncharacterized protein LOC117122962 [Anneissia japonica]XP_033124634.1 uncharacterized protein LOC117122962 [Anneissia japonica]XP_0
MDNLKNLVSCVLLIATLSVRNCAGIEETNIYNLTITPKDIYVVNGTSVKMYCHVDSHTRTANELVWYAINETMRTHLPGTTANNSVLVLNTEPPLGDSTYYCAFSDDLAHYEATVVHTGYKAQKAKNFACHSRNIISFWCYWEVVREDHVLITSSSFHYKPLGGAWQDCIDLRSDSDGNRCIISMDNDPLYNSFMYEVQVKTSNVLDNTTSRIYFNPHLQVQPYPPNNLNGEALDGTRLNITWELPLTWVRHYLLKCEVGYRRKLPQNQAELPKTKRTVEDCSEIMEFVIENLHPATTYEVTIRAIFEFSSSEAWSDWSDDIELLTNEEVPSGSVSHLRKTTENVDTENPSLRKFYLVWDEVPKDQCNGAILGYNIYITEDDRFPDRPTYNVSGSRRNIEISVDLFDTFRIYVVAFNSAGEGKLSLPLDIYDMTRIPGKPVNVKTTALSASSVLVEWSEPVEIHGRILFYMVDWKKTSRDQEWSTEEVEGSEHSYVVSGLVPYTHYEFRVQANNSAGLGAWSISSQVLTHESDPTSFPQDITLTTVHKRSTELLLTWRPPDRSYSHGKILVYNIYYCEKYSPSTNTFNASDEIECDAPDALNFTDVDEQETGESFYRYTVTDLKMFTEYLLWMSASNSAGEGILSHRVSAMTDEGAPEKPDPPVKDEVQSFSVSIHWKDPQKPNGNITKYIVHYGTSTGIENCIHVYERNAVVTEKIYGNERYNFTVSACNDNEDPDLCSPFSDPLIVTTLVGIPEPVVDFTVDIIATDKVGLSWKEPAHPNGIISHYIVSYRPENITDSKWTNKTVKGLSATIQVDCETGATFFTYFVAAVTRNGSKALIGTPTLRRYEMCRKFPVPVIIMAVLIPGLVLMMAVACFYIIKVKKLEIFKPFPEPRFIEDFIIKPWDAPLKPEKEHFDKLKTFNDRYTAPPNIMQEKIAPKTSMRMDSDQGFDETEVMVEMPSIHDKNTNAIVRSSSSSQGIGRSIVGPDNHPNNVVEDFEGDDAVFDLPVETCFDNEYYPMVNNQHVLGNSDVKTDSNLESIPDGNSYAVQDAREPKDHTLVKRQDSLESHGSVEYHTMSNDGLIPITLAKDDISNSSESLPSSQKPVELSQSNDYQCIGTKDFLPPTLNTSSVDNCSTTSDCPASPDSFEYGLLGHSENVQQALLVVDPSNQQHNNINKEPVQSSKSNRNEPDVSGDYVCSPTSLTDHDSIDPYTVIPIGGSSPPQSYNSMPYSQISVRPSEVREGNLSDGVTKCNYSRIPECSGPLTPPVRTQNEPVFEVPDSGIDSDHSNNSLGLEVIPVESPEFNTDGGNIVSLPTSLAGNTVMQRPQTQLDIEPLIIDDFFAPTCEL